MGRKISVVVVVVVALLAAGCGDDDSDGSAGSTTTTAGSLTGPQNYTVVVDGPSTLGAENLVYGTYFPNRLAVRPGDTVLFDNRSSNDIHTVTFGVKSDRSDQPPPETPDGQANPAAFGPCFTNEPAKPALTCPPRTAGFPEYAGIGYWSAGVIFPTSLPAEVGPKQATVKFAPEIAPGTYTVVCTLHKFMEATVEVVASDQDRLTPAQVAVAADKELGGAKSHGESVAIPTPGTVANGTEVLAGWGDKLLAVDRFHPETASVKVGQTVKWRGLSPYMPHTVSFSTPYKSPDEKDALLPLGVKAGGRYSDGVAHSGIFGPKPDYPKDGFSLVFTKAGRYPYLCLLHPGMAGTVLVE